MAQTTQTQDPELKKIERDIDDIVSEIKRLREKLGPNADDIAKVAYRAIVNVLLEYEDYCNYDEKFIDAKWQSISKLVAGLHNKLTEKELKDLANHVDEILVKSREQLDKIKSNLYTYEDIDELREEICQTISDIATAVGHVDCVARGCRCGGIDYDYPVVDCGIDESICGYCREYTSLTDDTCCPDCD